MSRYENIAGMLEDPRNLACVLREIYRREKKNGGSLKIMPPPIKHTETRFLYPTFREFLRMKKFSQVRDPETIDILAEVFSTGDSVWYFSLADGSEIGPVDSYKSAKKNGETLFLQNGYIILEQPPWEDEDCKQFPV